MYVPCCNAALNENILPQYYTFGSLAQFDERFKSVQCYTMQLHCVTECLDCHISNEFSVTFTEIGFYLLQNTTFVDRF